MSSEHDLFPKSLSTGLALVPDYDYHAPLDDLATLPSCRELKQLYSGTQIRSRIIHALCQGHTVTWACRYGGVSCGQVYEWKKEMPEFAAAMEEAQNGSGGDVWEELLLDHAQRSTPAAVTATIVGLKMRGRFRETPVQSQPIQIQILNYHGPELPAQKQLDSQGET